VTDLWPVAGTLLLSGDGVVLREWADADRPAMIALFDEPSIDRWTPLESPFDQDAAGRYLARAAQRRRQGTALQLVITEDGRAPLGEVLLFDHGESDGGDRVGEVGYSLGLSHRGRGLATRAVRLLADHACAHWRFRLLRLRIESGNVASERVGHRCGFLLTPAGPLHLESKGRSIELRTWERTFRAPRDPA